MSIELEPDVDHFQREGWVRVDNVVPKKELDAVVDLVCEFFVVDRERMDPRRKFSEVVNGLVPVHQHQSLWDSRQEPAVHAAFSAIHGTERLWVSMDRASYKPRLSKRAKYVRGDANVIHVDKNLKDEVFTVQGVLYLTDTSEDQGAWECVPDVFREIRDDGRRDLRSGDDFSKYPLHKVPGKAGSLVIWDGRMPHSSGHNWSDKPRFAQYITMNKCGNEEERQSRIENWRQNRAPAYWRNLKANPHQLDPEPWGTPAYLTAHGKRILGLTRWS